MSERIDELAVRKDLLLARSAVQRALLRQEVTALRSRSATVPLVGVLTLLAGSSRAAGWIGKVAGILAIVRTALSVVRLLRR